MPAAPNSPIVLTLLKTFLFFSFFVLVSVFANCQTIQGVVTDAETHKPIFPATVVNARTQQVAYTSASGSYVITALPGDIIAFTCIGYRPEERVKPPSVIVATINVEMVHIDYQLDEVRLGPALLTRYQRDSMERKATYKSVLERHPPSPVMSPVSAIADKFSKKSQRAYQFQRDFAQAELQKYIDTRYTPSLVSDVTKTNGDTVAWFMYYHPMPYDFARAATILELKMWVLDNFKRWKIHNPMQDTLTGK